MERPPSIVPQSVNEKPKTPERILLEEMYSGFDLKALFNPDIECSYRDAYQEKREEVRRLLDEFRPGMSRTSEQTVAAISEFMEACRVRGWVSEDLLENQSRYFMSMARNQTNGVVSRIGVRRGEEYKTYRHPVSFDIASTLAVYHERIVTGEALLAEAKKRVRTLLQWESPNPQMPQKQCWWFADRVTLDRARTFLRRIRTSNTRSTPFLRVEGIYDYGLDQFDVAKALLNLPKEGIGRSQDSELKTYVGANEVDNYADATVQEMGLAARGNDWLNFVADRYARFCLVSEERRRHKLGSEFLNPFEPILQSWINGTPIIGCGSKKMSIVIPSAHLIIEEC